MPARSPHTILFLSPLPPPAGGIATWTARICANGLGERYVPLVVDTRLRGSRRNHERVRLTMTEAARTTWILSRYFWRLLSIRPDIVHINCSLSPYGVARDLVCARMARFFGSRVVVHYRGNVPDYRSSAAGGRARRWFASLASLAGANLVLNQPSLHAMKTLLGKDSNTVILPNFMEAANSVLAGMTGAVPASFRLIYVGGMTGPKGGREVLEVARRLPAVEVVVVGDVMEDMRSDVAHWPTNVRYAGHVDHDEALRLMSESHALLFPSYSEGFPNAVLEAMSLGLPVIATNVGAIPEMIDDQVGGMLVERGDVEGMAKAAEGLRCQPSLRERMGRHNQEKCRRDYAYAPVTEQLVRIYDVVLARKGLRRSTCASSS